MTMIGYGIARANWHIWLPGPAEQEEVWIGSRYIYAGCALSLASGIWSPCQGQSRLGDRLRRAARDSGGLGGTSEPL